MCRLKCDRVNPCQNCVARSQEDACYFRGNKDHPARRPQADGAATQERIEHLERLVKHLLSERAPPTALPVSSNSGEEPLQIIASHESLPPDSHFTTATGKTLVEDPISVFRGNDWRLVLQEVLMPC